MVITSVHLKTVNTDVQDAPIIFSLVPVAAGIGPFEPSFANEYSLIAGIYFATDLTNFLSNPTYHNAMHIE